MDILIVIEDNNSKVHRMGLECITAAQQMAKESGLSIAALVMGSNADGLASQVKNYDINEVLTLKHENKMDIVTAISGSGPAYVFLLSECLAKAGIKLGLSKNLAERLGRVTISGSGELLHQSTEDVVTLRQNVTSSGGTTEAALTLLMGDDRLETLLYDAIQKAFKRSKELAH